MKIAIACDHAGFDAAKDIRLLLENQGHECLDFGPRTLNQNDDYPDFVLPAAQAVAGGKCERGIIIGGSGQGEMMAANRVKGVRCALFYNTAVAKRAVDAEGDISHDPYEIIKLSRLHNDSNMLSLAARFLSPTQMAQAIRIWLETDFSGEGRHTRRIAKLDREVD